VPMDAQTKRQWHNLRRRRGFCLSADEVRAERQLFFREKMALSV
jgi:hypothetical protein